MLALGYALGGKGCPLKIYFEDLEAFHFDLIDAALARV